MASTRSWDRLAPRTQQRYLAAGRSGKLSGEPLLSASESRAYYELGGDLRAARGHALRQPRWAAPKVATTHESLRIATAADERSIRRWRESKRPPKWLPTSRATLSDSTAAILSRLTKGPDQWASVTVTPLAGDGRKNGFRMEVLMRGSRYPEVVILPDWDSTSEVGRLLNDHARAEMARTLFQRTQLAGEWDRARIRVSITGTETKAIDQSTKKLTVDKKKPAALPQKSTKKSSGAASKKSPPPVPTPLGKSATKPALKTQAATRRATAGRVKGRISGSTDALASARSKTTKRKRGK